MPFDGLVSQLDTARRRISELEYTAAEVSQTEMKRERKKQDRKSQGVQGNFKRYNTHIIGTRRGERTEQKNKLK